MCYPIFMQIPKKRRVNLLSDDEPIYLTAQGIARLQARLARLKRELPGAIAEAARTGAYGDRSDNAEYKEAKGILRRTQRQVWNLEEEMKRVVEIKPGRNASETIQLGSTVTLELKNGNRKKFQILGTLETDPEKGIISHKSPLGAALMDHRTGEKITIKTAKGKWEYGIIKID
jgi:transcription elongation GreA/GreB family factor